MNTQICPFSYIAHKELRDAIIACAHLPIKFDIQYRPYMLITDIKEDESVDKETFYRSKLKENFESKRQAINEAADRVGLDMWACSPVPSHSDHDVVAVLLLGA